MLYHQQHHHIAAVFTCLVITHAAAIGSPTAAFVLYVTPSTIKLTGGVRIYIHGHFNSGQYFAHLDMFHEQALFHLDPISDKHYL
jgi:hypothetical protein